MEKNEQLLKDAQFRKGLSIAFFNATNAAVELCKVLPPDPAESVLQKVVRIRDFFLEEHKTYYATVIAKVGVNYDAAESIKKLKAAKTLQELKTAWLLLSEDERRDDTIAKVAQTIKESHEKVRQHNAG